MSDEKNLDALPTRDNHPVGKSTENRMLAKTGRLGNDSFIKDQRNIVGPEGQKGVVKLKTRGGMPEFTTEFEETEDQDDLCPLTDHGLVDCYFNAFYNYDGTVHTEGAPLKELVDHNGFLIRSAKLNNSVPVLEKLHYTMASMFSGLMRRVVQLEQGKKDAGKFGFSPNWGSTHGLWCAGNGARWLIEIEGVNVYKRKISFCQKLPADWKAKEEQWFGTLPLKKAIKKVAPYWTVTKLGETRTLIGTIPALEGGPFYSWCGWAFSYDGSKACVVLNKSVEVGYAYAQWNALHELTIAGNDKGEPVSVTHAELESGWFINRNMRDDSFNLAMGGDNGSLQVPYTSPGQCRTHSFWSPLTMGEQTLVAPVFAYYLKTGEMHVLRFESPWKPNDLKDEGYQYKNEEIYMEYLGYRVDFGSYNEVGYPAPIINPAPIGPYMRNLLGTQTVVDTRYLAVGSFYSSLSPKAPVWTTIVTDIYKAETYGDATSEYDVDLNSIDSTGRVFEKKGYIWYPVPDWHTVPWHSFVQSSYERIYQKVTSKSVRNVHTHIEEVKSISPFAVLHGFDRESYCAGFGQAKSKTTTTNTTNEVGTYDEASGNVCEAIFGSSEVRLSDDGQGHVDRITWTTVGIYNVTAARFPRFSPGSGGVPAPEEIKTENEFQLMSKLVLGSQAYSLNSSGFGQYGPDALNFLYFKAAGSAFKAKDGGNNHMRSPDFQNLHLITTCGSYTATNITNSFVGVI